MLSPAEVEEMRVKAAAAKAQRAELRCQRKVRAEANAEQAERDWTAYGESLTVRASKEQVPLQGCMMYYDQCVCVGCQYSDWKKGIHPAGYGGKRPRRFWNK